MTAKRKRSTTTTIDAPVQVMTPPPVNGDAPAPVETVTPQPADASASAPSGSATKDGAAPVPNPEVETIIAAERRAKGIAPRPLPADEIVARFMAAMVNEAARVVGDGIARCPADVDVVMLSGYGFPRWRGGPMHYADTVGPESILADIDRFSAEDAFLWQPAPLLARLATQKGKFASLNG